LATIDDDNKDACFLRLDLRARLWDQKRLCPPSTNVKHPFVIIVMQQQQQQQ